MREEVSVRTGERDSERIREHCGNQDPIEQSRQGIYKLTAAIRSARSTHAYCVKRHAETFDEVLFAHHRGFTRQNRVAVLRHVLEGVAEQGIALAESRGTEQTGINNPSQ